MIPEEIFKRRTRHNNTPESVLLIITNVMVFAVITQLFANCNKINNFYWIILGLLALYNVYSIRKNREEYKKPQIIAYILGLVCMAMLFFLLRGQSGNC